MSRAVFLSAGGDPFISSLVLKLWKERWYDEVDRFYIDYNNHAGVPLDASVEFIANAISDPKVHVIYHPQGIGNGMPITELALIAKEDHVLLLEDDGFIFGTGIVDECFKRLENDEVDLVGSSRFSIGFEVADAVKAKYGLDYSGLGDKGPCMWPNFFFCKRTDLLKTDLNFASKEFTKGTYYKEIDHTMSETEYADTFGWGFLQMRALGLRCGEVPQYHASPEEIEFYERGSDKWSEEQNVRWIHGGSLSSGWGGYLSGRIPDVSTLQSKMEIESRCAFWRIAAESTEGFTKFKTEYLQGIENLVIACELSRDRLQKKYNIYKTLLQV